MRVHLVVSGRVQGVGFRYTTVREARRAGVTGWVRNTRDGRVEIVADGTADAIEAFVAWVRRGPDAAAVTKLERAELVAGESFDKFEVR